MIEKIRNSIRHEEFDYQTLTGLLASFARPRDKISDLLKKKQIIRVKKGLYVFGEGYRRKPYSRELLANLIFGPSYISIDYALQYYDLIPERVEAVTSVCVGRSRVFMTPLGTFTYHKIPRAGFRNGMDRIVIDDQRSFLLAVPEKALSDKIYIDRGTAIRSQKELSEYLEKDLRLDMSVLRSFKPELVEDLARRFRSRKIQLLYRLIRRLNG